MLILFAAFFTLATSCTDSDISSDGSQMEFVKGVYGNPGTLIDAGYDYSSLGMNAVFVRSVSLNEKFYQTAKDEGMQVFVEFPTLLGRNYVDEHPGAWPVDENGENSPPADWFMGVCPTDPGFLEFRKNQLRNILDKFDVDGIFLDYVHWHAQFETPEPILPETCFCDRCTALFGDYANIEIPGTNIPQKAQWILENADSEWRAWRSRILNGWVSGMKEIVKEKQPDANLGIFYCSWFPDDYDSALYRTLGIDVEAFAEMADVLSPMLFHKMKDRPVKWVSDYTNWLGNMLADNVQNLPFIWPIVQSHDNPTEVTSEEFRNVMLEGAKPPSTGIMMFSDQSLLDNPEKIRVMKKLYTGELPVVD